MHPYETRKTSYFKLLSFRTSIRKRCISIRGPRLWYSLPADIQNCYSAVALKRLALAVVICWIATELLY